MRILCARPQLLSFCASFVISLTSLRGRDPQRTAVRPCHLSLFWGYRVRRVGGELLLIVAFGCGVRTTPGRIRRPAIVQFRRLPEPAHPILVGFLPPFMFMNSGRAYVLGASFSFLTGEKMGAFL